MTIDKLPSGSYRVTQYLHGKRYRKTFDHKPNQKEIAEAFNDLFEDSGLTDKGTFETYAQKYIAVKENVLSPATVRSYGMLLRNMPDDFKNKQLKDLTNSDVQSAINIYSASHAPKTVRNMSGFISSVCAMYRPGFTFNATLPQKIPTEYYIPTADEVKAVLNYAKGKTYEVAFYLGAYGLRRSEVCALTLDDLEGRVLHIRHATVQNKDNQYIEKKTTKTYSSARDVVISEELADKIRDQGYIYNNQPYQILRALHRCQKALGLPEFRFHDLRHFFITEMFAANIPEADIISLVGHSTDYTTKKVYRHSRISNDNKAKEKVSDYLSNLIT